VLCRKNSLGDWQPWKQATTASWVKDTTAPVITLGAPLRVHTTSPVSADVADANSFTVLWTQISGPGHATFGFAAAASTTVMADSDGVYVLRLTATDVAGNVSSADLAFTWDTARPAVTINQDAGQADPTNAGPVQFNVVWSKPIDPAVLTPTAITQLGTAAVTTWSIVHVSGGTNFLLSAVVIATDGTVQPSIVAGLISDSAGNTNLPRPQPIMRLLTTRSNRPWPVFVVLIGADQEHSDSSARGL